jgi:hypothetical protein
MDGQKQNSIDALPNLNSLRLENLFKVYNDNKNYYYNILGTVNIPNEIDASTYTTFTVTSDYMPWTHISQKIYNTPELWWLICSTNNIQNPIQFPKAGTVLKVLLPSYVTSILQQLNNTQ